MNEKKQTNKQQKENDKEDEKHLNLCLELEALSLFTYLKLRGR